MRILNAGSHRGKPIVLFLGVQMLFLQYLAALDFNDWFSVGGVAAATGMYQSVSGDPGTDGASRVTAPLQLEFSLHPSETHELFAKGAFAEGDGLAETGTFALVPWGVDHEDDVKNINGRGRDYLLTAYYRLSLDFGGSSLALTAGIIDSVDFLGGNEFAADEYTQFLNEAFVFNGSHGLPSYDYGVAVKSVFGDWTFTGLVMDIGENDEGNEYLFWGAQAAYAHESDLGNGNIRLLFVGTDSEFPDPSGTAKENCLGISVSCDQEFGEAVGGFVRLGWQQQDAVVNYKAFYSGGLNIPGSMWGRESDNIGVGYAYLQGGNAGIGHTHVFEAYYRCVINGCFAVTGDVQFMSDSMDTMPSPNGWMFGIRSTFEF